MSGVSRVSSLQTLLQSEASSARKVKHLLCRDGRYFARVVVPKELRVFLGGKTELRTALGPDRRAALNELHSAVADSKSMIEKARTLKAETDGGGRTIETAGLPVGQIARIYYEKLLRHDEDLRNNYVGYATIGIDDFFVQQLRDGIAGRLRDDALSELMGPAISMFFKSGFTKAAAGTPEWRQLGRALCIAEYEALERMVERDDGNLRGETTHPLLEIELPPQNEPDPVSLKKLCDDYLNRCGFFGGSNS